MSVNIDTAFVKQYKNNVMLLSQQKGSRLRAHVREESVGAEFAFFEQIGPVTARKRRTRHSDTPRMNTPHDRRRVTTVPYDWADLVDNEDKIRTLIDPTNSYAMNASFAMGRAMDEEILSAATGIAVTGKEGTVNVALPSTQKIAVGSTGLTLAKLLSAKEILDASEVDPDTKRVIIVSSRQVTNLLNTTEIKSSDYNTVKALAKGEIDTFLGFNFIRTQLGTLEGSVRTVPCWLTDGILLGIGKNPTARINERTDKNYATQVFYSQDLGATRMEETKVVEIKCQEG